MVQVYTTKKFCLDFDILKIGNCDSFLSPQEYYTIHVIALDSDWTEVPLTGDKESADIKIELPY